MRTALANLRTSLQRIRDITLDIDANALRALQNRSTLEMHETIQCATTVIVSGFFESFLKDVAEAFISVVTAKGIPFLKLPPKIQKTHFEDGGAMVARKARNRGETAWIMCTTHDLARRLGSVVTSVTYEIVWEAFADTKANPGPENIRCFMQRFGIAKVWPKLASKAKVSESLLITNLESYIRVRNECAHSGSALNIPTPNDVRDYCDQIDRLANAIVEVLEDHCASF
jgi:hypothetical protein